VLPELCWYIFVLPELSWYIFLLTLPEQSWYIFLLTLPEQSWSMSISYIPTITYVITEPIRQTQPNLHTLPLIVLGFARDTTYSTNGGIMNFYLLTYTFFLLSLILLIVRDTPGILPSLTLDSLTLSYLVIEYCLLCRDTPGILLHLRLTYTHSIITY